ncbi:flagellin [Sedimentitalea arenosa]|uniref:Flagellar biosynthesis protein FlgL n=1 Tax=Sedimentitalea arenosa TaxID=2798803 RepID=A0A8J7LW49_9RHOB|nr:flagellin [Arenibacterium arenosum]MBJ6371820.1 flagellar biosynthesis protein FlgL [Arenibacterium arenosum]
MNMTSIGDLAQTLMLRSRSAELKQTVATLSNELSTGRVSDAASRVGNDFGYLSDIDRNLTRLEGFTVAASEARLFTDAAQVSLETIQNDASRLSSAMISVNPSTLSAVGQNLGTQARDTLGLTIGALNSSAGGRSLFAGVATDRAPLASVDTMMSELKTLVAGMTDAGDVRTAVDDWFSDPSGFKAVMYGGADDTLAPFQIGPGQEVGFSLKADDAEFRNIMSGMALAALAGDASLGFDTGLQAELFRHSAGSLTAGQDGLTAVRADLGFAEARIEDSIARNESARTGLEYARNALLEADPFETATRLEQAQFQLETLYTVTVRSSKLSLLNFMR